MNKPAPVPRSFSRKLIFLRLRLTVMLMLYGLYAYLYRCRTAGRYLVCLMRSGYRSPRYLTKLLVPLFRPNGFGRIREFLIRTRGGKEASIINTAHSSPAAGEPLLLTSPRVRRLQARIIGIYFRRQFAITPDRIDLEIFSQRADVRSLAAELIDTAGCRGRAVLDADALYRIRTVYPAFVAGLSLATASSTGRLLKGVRRITRLMLRCRLRRWRKGLGLSDSRISMLYPARLDAERYTALASGITELYAGLKVSTGGKLKHDLFDLYLRAVAVLTAHAAADYGRTEHLLRSLEDIHLRSLNSLPNGGNQ